MARLVIRILALVFTCWQAISGEDVAGGCTNGFIQLDMLRTVAQEIPHGTKSTNRLSDELRLIPDWNFTCNGTITSFMLGADIRSTRRGMGDTIRNVTQYPEVQIWRRTNSSSPVREYAIEWSEEVRLDAGYFSPSGVLEYRLNNSFNFQAGDIFGVYQPRQSNSVVRIYYNDNDNTAPVAYRQTGLSATGSSYNIDSNFSMTLQQLLLISPVTDSPCTSGFISFEALKNKVYDVNIFNNPRPLGRQRIFPDINFTCSGNLTKWIVGGTVGNALGVEVQIWRRNDYSDNDYTKVGYSILNADNDRCNVYEYIPDPPLEFQEGDILGVYQQRSDMRVYYQDTTGPANYAPLDVDPPAPATLNDPTLVVSQYDYPLVTVEISVSTPTSSIQVEPSETINIITQTAGKCVLSPTSSAPAGFSGAAVGGAIAALLILAVFAATVILTVVLVKRHYEKKAAKQMNNQNTLPLNQVNTGEKEGGRGELYLPVELYGKRPESYIYDECDSNLEHTEQDKDEEYYSSVPQEDKEPLYWTPADDCSGIYQQFSSKGFREITADQIQKTAELGSGQFGCVNKGVWYSPKGPVDVAIKTLKTESTEEQMVKFLQEAAIMGQFHHPNIVELHGVVTVGEPIMIVLELMNQDLKAHLFALRPTPGEVVPPLLPQQLLWYCRQIASGMEYLSKKSFVHRDLAARNILVDDERTCKIADFGMSRDLEDDKYYTSSGGLIPIKWTAIEALHFKKYSTASDVWSFGVLMYEIWSLGHKPFDNLTNTQTIELIRKGVRLSPPPGCPRAIYKLMIQCWHPETSGRPSFTSLIFRLSQPEIQLLQWTDTITHDSQSTMLGAPMETASNLHSDLQQQYTST